MRTASDAPDRYRTASLTPRFLLLASPPLARAEQPSAINHNCRTATVWRQACTAPREVNGQGGARRSGVELVSLPRRSVWPDAALIPAATPSSFAVARFVSCSGSVALAARPSCRRPPELRPHGHPAIHPSGPLALRQSMPLRVKGTAIVTACSYRQADPLSPNDTIPSDNNRQKRRTGSCTILLISFPRARPANELRALERNVVPQPSSYCTRLHRRSAGNC